MTGRIPKVVVLGPAYVDVSVKCDQFPQVGEMIEGSGFSCITTGAGCNRAIEASLCGCESYLVGKVGEDAFGRMIKHSLDRHGVHTDFVYTAGAMSTGTIVTISDSTGENSGVVCAGANRSLSSDEMGCAEVEQLIGSADVCLIDGDLAEETVATAIRTANLYQTKVIIEAELAIDAESGVDGFDMPKEHYSVNILVPRLVGSGGFCEGASGNFGELKFIGSELVARGIECVVMMGIRNSLIVDKDGTTQVKGFETELVDRGGCEDAFAGALAASCGAGDDPAKAVRFAAAAGALACTKFGCQEALPRKEEILKLLLEQPE